MTSSRQVLDQWGDPLAKDYFAQQRYVVVEQNFRSPDGEIALIVRKHDLKVKARATRAYGLPEEAITTKKREHLITAVQPYLQISPAPVMNWRIDVIAIRKFQTGAEPEIVHFENAIS